MANKFVGFLETVGKDFAKGVGFAVKEAPAFDPIISLLFPGSTVAVSTATSALSLLNNTIIAVEQKYAAAGQQAQTGAQKAADVLSIAGPAAATLLTSAGVPNVDTDYISRLINVIVTFLNFKAPVATA